jgi:hypothetical protein
MRGRKLLILVGNKTLQKSALTMHCTAEFACDCVITLRCLRLDVACSN